MAVLETLKTHKWFALAAVVAAVIILLNLLSFFQSDSVVAIQVEKEDITATLTITGEVRADQSVSITPEVASHIEAILVDEGHQVTRGQTLAVLDSETVAVSVSMRQDQYRQAQASLQNVLDGSRPEEVQRLASALTESQNNFDLSKAKASAAEANHQNAQADYLRMKALYDQELISLKELDASKTKAAVEKANKDLALAEVKAAQSRIEQINQQLSQAQNGATAAQVQEATANRNAAQSAYLAAQKQLTIKSPINGVVTDRLQDPGDLARPGQEILKLIDPSSIELVGFVEEVDLSEVTLNAKCFVTLDALPEEAIPGTIVEIGKEVNPANGTIEATVAIEASALKGLFLLPGMTADINIMTQSLKDAMVIPATAVERQNNKSVVYKLVGGSVQLQTIEAKRISLEYYQVIEGLQTGDWIALNAKPNLLEKRFVQPVKAAPVKKEAPKAMSTSGPKK